MKNTSMPIDFLPCKSIRGDLLFDIDFPKQPSRTQNFTYEYPFNLAFSIKKGLVKSDFKGPAIYAIEYENEIIYIGKYKPENNNIISTRWVKHLMTFTNRGYRVGGSALRKLVEGEFKDYTFNDEFEKNITNYFQDNDTSNPVNEKRYDDTGTVTSFNRLKFADSIAAKDNFLEHKTIDISKFTFNCFTLSGNKDDIVKRKELVGIVEQILILKHKPRCNKEADNESLNLRLFDFENDLHRSLVEVLSVLDS